MVDFHLIACFIPVRTGPSVIELGLTRLRLSAALTLGLRQLIDGRERLKDGGTQANVHKMPVIGHTAGRAGRGEFGKARFNFPCIPNSKKRRATSCSSIRKR